MKTKSIIVLLLVLLLVMSSVLLLTACDSDSFTNGTYYKYIGLTKQSGDYLVIKNGKWSDAYGLSGTYQVSGNTVTFECDGWDIGTYTYSDGKLSITLLGTTSKYMTDKMATKLGYNIDVDYDMAYGTIYSATLIDEQWSGDPTLDVLRRAVQSSGTVTYFSFGTTFISLTDNYTYRIYDKSDNEVVSQSAMVTAGSNYYIVRIYNANGALQYQVVVNVYVLQEVTVTYISDGSVFYSTEVEEGNLIPQPSSQPTMSDTSFEGWVDSDGNIVDLDTYEVWGTTTLYAIGPYYTISFETNGGSDIAIKNVAQGDTIVLPTPTRDGYIFGGWYTSSALSGTVYTNSYTATEDVTLYAAWTSWSSIASFTPVSGGYELSSFKADICSFEIPSTYNGEPVVSIGERAFIYCRNLTSITIPDSVTSIGDYAFYGCCNLVEVYNLSSISITAGSQEFGCVAYYALSVYTTTESATKLSTDSNGFVTYTDGDDVILVGYTGTATDITIPNNVTAIYPYIFADNHNITRVVIPNSVISIGESAFDYCSSLTSVVIPDSVISIGDNAFCECISLTSVTIGEGVISIGRGAFDYCSSLTNITIPASVTSIGDYAFSSCSSLTSVVFDDTSTWYMTYDFDMTFSTEIDVTDPATAATYLASTYYYYYWYKL